MQRISFQLEKYPLDMEFEEIKEGESTATEGPHFKVPQLVLDRLPSVPDKEMSEILSSIDDIINEPERTEEKRKEKKGNEKRKEEKEDEKRKEKEKEKRKVKKKEEKKLKSVVVKPSFISSEKKLAPPVRPNIYLSGFKGDLKRKE